MTRMRRAPAIILDDPERQTLQRWARGRSTPARLVLRAQIVLRAADGMENLGIAESQSRHYDEAIECK